jgi:hypothetical protein
MNVPSKISLKTALAALSLVTLGACASAPKQPTGPEMERDVVVSRIDNLSNRPGWLKESEPVQVSDGYVTSLGETLIPADHRVDAAFRIAENNAKSQIAKAIEQRLDFVFQNAEEGTAMDSTQARFIGAEAANLTTSTLRLDKRYWEKVATTQDNGQRVTQYRVFVTVKMPEADFKRSVLDAIRKQQGKGGISADFAKKVDEHWDRFTSAQGRKSASEE